MPQGPDIFCRTSDIVIPPGAYLLLTKDSSLVHHARGAVAMSGGQRLRVSFAQQQRRCRRDLRRAGSQVDSLVYRPEWGGGEEGRSLERRDADAPSTEPDGWATCVHPSGATPGLPNSVIRHLHDIAIERAFAVPGAVDTVVAVVRNSGKMPVSRFALLVYDDIDMDSVAAPGELAGRSETIADLSPGDSMRVPLGMFSVSRFSSADCRCRLSCR